jgi:hypothetical protein
MGKLQLKFVTTQVVPPQVAQMKTWRRLAILLMKTEEVPLRSLVQPLIRNMPANSKGGLEHVLELCNLCALVAH